MVYKDYWAGMVAEFRGGTPLMYPVVMALEEDHIEVDYPTLHCSGIIRPLDFDGRRFRGKEEITAGLGNCAQGVEVHLNGPVPK